MNAGLPCLKRMPQGSSCGVSLGLACFGMTLFLAACADWVLLAWVARFVSEDGQLSQERWLLFASGQRWFGGALAILGLCNALLTRFLSWMMYPLKACSPRQFAIALFVTGLFTAAWSYWGLFGGIPHVTDAISHLFQAKIFAAGAWYAAAPPCPLAFFQHHVMITAEGKWFTKYTPGHSLLLAAGLILHDPGLFVLVAHALLLVAVFSVGYTFFDDGRARWIALGVLFSPLSILLSGSLMSHTTFLCSFLLGIWALVRYLKREKVGWAIAAGFLFGWSFLIRPHEFFISSFALAIGAMVSNPRWIIPWIFRASPWIAIGFLPCMGMLAIWNLNVYGRPWALGYGFTADTTLFPMFQASFGFREGFGWKEAFRLTLHRLIRFDQVLLGWPVTLPFLLICLAALSDARMRFLGAVAITHIGVYFFYDYLGHEFESRYYFNLVPVTLAMLVAGIRRWVGQSSKRRTVVALISLASCVHSIGNYWPRAIFPAYSDDYEQATRCLHDRARAEISTPAVVLIDGDSPETAFRYSSGFIFNDIRLTGPIVYARGEYPEPVDCLRLVFPDRVFYRYVAPADRWCAGRFIPLETNRQAGNE